MQRLRQDGVFETLLSCWDTHGAIILTIPTKNGTVLSVKHSKHFISCGSDLEIRLLRLLEETYNTQLMLFILGEAVLIVADPVH